MTQFENYPFLNSTTFAMLKKSTAGKPEFLVELFQSFIDDSKELMLELDNCKAEKNLESYYTSVHTLKGLCGTIGCTRMFEVLKTMDKLNKGSEFEDSMSYLPELKTVFAETSEAIKLEVFSTVDQPNNENT